MVSKQDFQLRRARCTEGFKDILAAQNFSVPAQKKFSMYDFLKTLLVSMDHGYGLKNRGTFASEASGPQKWEKLHLSGNLNFFGYGGILLRCRADANSILLYSCTLT